MPTETNARVEIAATNPCSNCDAPVAIRRPSKTGRHYCQAMPCQAAKQRYYARLRAETGFKSLADQEAEAAELARRQAEARDELFLAVIRAVVTNERVYCEECKRKDALPGYIHPDPETGAPCRALRELPLPSGAGDRIVSAIWPS
jgi:hypothetical protein